MNAKLNVLVIGSGGREHALTTAISSSEMLGELYVAPGNAGTSAHNVDLDVDNHEAVVSFCRANAVNLVVVGPEGPLVAGIADALAEADVACFGPSKAAAQLEGSKSFARQFAARHSIPGPAAESFADVGPALEWVEALGKPVVVKADGLASGKGVIIPESTIAAERAIYDLLADRTMGDAGATIVVEECIEGEEISLFGLADGSTVVSLGIAQDHKRVGDGDTGLNTGGMGAFAPVPGMASLEPDLIEEFLTKVVDGMAAEGMPYVGVLYAGIMLTADGPRLIEYNCRFGDPETQVLLPLIKSDVLELLYNAATGKLEDTNLDLATDVTAATVVVAARGYPTSPAVGIEIPQVEAPEHVNVVHSSTSVVDGRVANTGGRVLSITGTGPDLAAALDRVYSVVDDLVGPELFARTDIGWRHAPRAAGAAPGSEGDAYAKAGVSFEAAKTVTERISASVASTHDERVVSGIGGFGGVFDLASLSGLKDPLLVASTDGVGTKTVIAEQLDIWESIGADIVNHGINDVIVQGARPLFFLDTIAAASLSPDVVARILEGMAAACRDANCILLGGETAEMPDVLTSGSVDVSGTMIGAVSRQDLLPKPTVAPGQILVALGSSGLHTNGYSLARKVVSGEDLSSPLPGGNGETVGEALLEPHRSYLEPLSDALDQDLIQALAHITGGGIIDNLPRVLPEGCGAQVETGSWEWPPLFTHLARLAGLTKHESHQIFNLGVGMIAIVEPGDLEAFQKAVPEPTTVIGEVIAGSGVTLI